MSDFCHVNRKDLTRACPSAVLQNQATLGLQHFPHLNLPTLPKKEVKIGQHKTCFQKTQMGI